MIEFIDTADALRPFVNLQREWNNIVKATFANEVSDFVAGRLMPRHFSPEAYAAYNMRPRSSLYNRLKRLKLVWNYRTGQLMIRPFPPLNLVWTGDMREKLLTAAPSSFFRRAVAFANKLTLEIRFPLGHFVAPNVALETVVLNQQDATDLSRFAAIALSVRVAEYCGHGVLPLGQSRYY